TPTRACADLLRRVRAPGLARVRQRDSIRHASRRRYLPCLATPRHALPRLAEPRLAMRCHQSTPSFTQRWVTVADVTTPCLGTRWRRTRCRHLGCSSRTLRRGARSKRGSTGPDARSRSRGFARTRHRASRTCGLLRSVRAVAHDLRPDQAGAAAPRVIGALQAARVVVVLELEDPAGDLGIPLGQPPGRPDVHLVAGPLPVLVEGCGHSTSSGGCRWSAMSSTRLGFLVRPWSTSSRSTAATALLVVSHGWKCAGTGATAVQAAAQVAFISSSANFSAVTAL